MSNLSNFSTLLLCLDILVLRRNQLCVATEEELILPKVLVQVAEAPLNCCLRPKHDRCLIHLRAQACTARYVSNYNYC